MANIRLVKPHFVSFDKDLEIVAHDIHRNAKYVYHASQDYFVQGKPSEVEKESMINKFNEAMKGKHNKRYYND
jgi:hypothetical protein